MQQKRRVFRVSFEAERGRAQRKFRVLQSAFGDEHRLFEHLGGPCRGRGFRKRQQKVER